MPSDLISIVPITPGEVDALRPLALAIFYASFSHNNTPENMKAYTDKAYNREQLLSELQEPRSEHYFLNVDGRHAGFLKLNRSGAQSDINDPDSLEIQRIYVDMAFQNRGLGKVMLDKAIERARALNLHYIWLGVWEHNPDAIRFYERHGFYIFGRHAFVMGDDMQTDVLMKLRIT
jgi:ribosomal protein S18 acetylase RimI-like enzyme